MGTLLTVSLCVFLFGFPVLIPKEKPPITVVGDVGGRIAIIVVSGGVTGLNTLLSLFTHDIAVWINLTGSGKNKLYLLFNSTFYSSEKRTSFFCFVFFGTWAQKISNYTTFFLFFIFKSNIIPQYILIYVNYRARTWLT